MRVNNSFHEIDMSTMSPEHLIGLGRLTIASVLRDKDQLLQFGKLQDAELHR